MSSGQLGRSAQSCLSDLSSILPAKPGWVNRKYQNTERPRNEIMKAVQNNVRRTGQIVRFVMRRYSWSGQGGQLVREREDRHVNVNDDLYHARQSCMIAGLVTT